jgi:hypothetical protein
VIEGKVFSGGATGLMSTPSVSEIVRNNRGTISAPHAIFVAGPSATSATYLIDNYRINFVDRAPSSRSWGSSGSSAVTITDNGFYISGATPIAFGNGPAMTHGALAMSGNVFDAVQTIYARAINVTVSSTPTSNNMSTAQANTPRRNQRGNGKHVRGLCRRDAGVPAGTRGGHKAAKALMPAA